MNNIIKFGALAALALLAYKLGRKVGQESVRLEMRRRPFLRARRFITMRPGDVVSEYRRRHPGHLDLQH